MNRLVDIVTLLWVVSFVVSFAGGTIGRIADVVCIAAGFVFVCELAAAYRRSGSFREFVRENLFELVMLVPVFRGLRLLRLSRRLKRLFFILDNLVEGIDMFRRVRFAALFGKITACRRKAI